ncbi:MAG TPA: DUF3772 domain-containing protein [Beijerinckiaceae bacterium]|nr:DUF3772 domain-containing protein [Beijerinckiaceae bacterium]
MTRALAILWLAFGLGWAAVAQTPAPRTDMEALRQELSQIEALLKRGTLADSELIRLRTRLEPIAGEVGEILAREQPRLDDINARLSQIGPKPDDKAPPESPEVARTRLEQETLKKEVDEAIRVARLLQVRTDQAGAAIIDQRRSLFRQEVLARSQSVLSPWLWADVLSAIPAAMSDLHASIGFRLRHSADAYDWRSLAAALALLLIGAAGAVPAHRILRQWDAVTESNQAPGRLDKALAALRHALAVSIVPLAFALLLTAAQEIILPHHERFSHMLRTAVFSVPLVLFLRGLTHGILSPTRPVWRLFALSDVAARRITATVTQLLMLSAFGKIVEAANQAISAILPFTVATRGMVALVSGSVLLRLLRALRRPQETTAGDDEFAGTVSAMVPASLAALALAMIITALLGYVALASLLVDQLLWGMAIAALIGLVLIVVDEVLARGRLSESRPARQLRVLTGIDIGSMRQAATLSSGVVKLLLYILAVLMFLAPLGVNSDDMLGSLRAAFFGFQLGGVTISISTLVLALSIFVLAVFVTRSIRRWLEGTFLPTTSLDTGLQNSILTVLGYIGFIIGAVAAMGTLGLGFDKITIVAGALSVGIGFGLQSIVNNFVSGLILLWERPIRVGDWIVVGEEQGKVQRINVRATQIETFDKASLIVPNSEFISGRVKNFMHANRTTRIIIPVGVSYDSNPETVRHLLLDAAMAHREVMSDPAPNVLFISLGESSLNFELRCFVDVDAMATTRSDLMFAIFEALRREKITVPFPTRTVEIADMNGLAGAIAARMPKKG